MNSTRTSISKELTQFPNWSLVKTAAGQQNAEPVAGGEVIKILSKCSSHPTTACSTVRWVHEPGRSLEEERIIWPSFSRSRSLGGDLEVNTLGRRRRFAGAPLQEWNAPPSGNVKRMRTHLHLQYRKRGEEEGEREGREGVRE